MAKKQIKRKIMKKMDTPKKCFFCTEKIEPNFLDSTNLSRFVTERGKIMSRSRSGLCSMHQRRLTSAVKHARHLALMPFVSRV